MSISRAWQAHIKSAVNIALLASTVALITAFDIEAERGLELLAVVTLIGFAVHTVLPMTLRPGWFLLVSISGLVALLRLDALWVLAIGTGLIGICHLRASVYLRVILLALVGAATAYARWELGSSRAWTVLGSMFMFRLVCYLYDLQHGRAPASWAQRLSYFFLLPNAVFPLFPVVDSSAYRRTYYNDDPHRIHQTGIRWILNGVIHLLIYRLVYYNLVLTPDQVHDARAFFQFIASTYLLYLRVSGMFHIAIGVVCLFGYNLPRTHNLYFLASGFTDFWRRINVYWKDFMMKIVFYPVFMRTRRYGQTPGMVLATLCVFIVSWMLHSYQWFWLRGDFPITLQDGMFWMGLGLLVAANTVYEQWPRPTPPGPRSRLRAVAGYGVRTASMFALMAVVWSFWTAERVDDWLTLWQDTTFADARAMGWLAVGLVGVAATGAFVHSRSGRQAYARQPSFGRDAIVNAAIVGVLGVIAVAPAYTSGSWTSRALVPLFRTSLNDTDAKRIVAGYYEQLLDRGAGHAGFWETVGNPRAAEHISETAAWRYTNDFFDSDLVPSAHVQFKGAALTTNRWSMRDKDYEQVRAADVYRIAIVGGSEVMGSGVPDDDVFAARLEAHLARAPLFGQNRKIEILNFALEGHFAVQRWMILERRVFSFDPQAVIYFGHHVDAEGTANFLHTSMHFGKSIPFPYLRDLVARAGVDGSTPSALAKKRLEPFHDEIVSWVYQQIVRQCRERGIVPVWIFLPSVYATNSPEHGVHETRVARDAGFVVIDMPNVYSGLRAYSLRVSASDPHPNRLAHQLIADGLYRALAYPSVARELGLAVTTSAAVPAVRSTHAEPQEAAR